MQRFLEVAHAALPLASGARGTVGVLYGDPENLRAAKALRLKTILVRGYRKPHSRKASPYIDHRVESSLILRATPS